ncbi:hypothetical protein RHMOL_Rhmol09G0218800 [Rhododendron molle]|uniref:Uncharacterized protein n=1 Tax=Rhododendron molle TaxID=49168 RepID=A0ACC0MG14_RHOML|nr:hypothetical protein RHMOL_Rhmol09G0218800 [Rhododendron molle]
MGLDFARFKFSILQNEGFWDGDYEGPVQSVHGDAGREPDVRFGRRHDPTLLGNQFPATFRRVLVDSGFFSTNSGNSGCPKFW